MNYQPCVSVIVPTYNAEDTIEDCIKSLLNLNYPKNKLQIIIINNSSTDKTSEILNKYINNVTILFESKKGAPAARNKGLINATGEVIVFTDSDCLVDKDWVCNIVKPLYDENIGIVGGRILAKRPCNDIEKYGEKLHDHERAINKISLPYAITMNWGSRLSVLKELGLFNEILIRCQDSDLARRIFYAGYKLVYKDDAIIYHNNRKTLRALFRQGYVHGYWGMKLNKIHKNYLSKYGYERFNLETYIKIFSSLIDYFKKNSNESMYYFIFNIGKKTGKLIGSVRFLYIEI